MEISIESVNTDKSHSWVRISHGLNKLVTDWIDKEYDDNEQETSETKTEADLPPHAHLQQLYLVVKEHGLILNQERNPIKHTQ